MKTTKTEIIKELWYRGYLEWLLYPHQRPIYQKIREILSSDDPEMNSYVLDISRQFGKSFIMFLIAVEECLRYTKWTNIFIGPLKSQVNEIINGKTYGTIFATCPKELLPIHKDSALIFPNGSRIRLAGTDNKNYENLRGGTANNIFLDEAGFMSDLEDGVLPAVEPLTKTTGGKVIFASTPPESLDHDYHDILRFHEEASLISTFTIWDDKSLTERQLEKIISQCKGRDTTKFKREYECKRIADSSKQVIPNFNKDKQEIVFLKNWKRDHLFNYWKKYVVADWGGRDKTAIIFAHYNYREKRVIIEDHLDLNGDKITPSIIATSIKDKIKHWEDSPNVYYICDSNNPLMQQEMSITYRLPFVPTSKGRLDGMVEKVKDWELENRIAYLEQAEFVMKSVSSAHWSKSRDEFARSKIYGHYDHLAALVYLIRNIDEVTDPIPVLHNVDMFKTFTMPNSPELIKNQRGLQQIFGGRK